MSTEGEHIMGYNWKSVGSTTAGRLGLRLARVDVDTAWHRVAVPKFWSVKDFFHQFRKCFANSDCSHRRSFDEKGVHPKGESLAFRRLYVSGGFLCRRQEEGGV